MLNSQGKPSNLKKAGHKKLPFRIEHPASAWRYFGFNSYVKLDKLPLKELDTLVADLELVRIGEERIRYTYSLQSMSEKFFIYGSSSVRKNTPLKIIHIARFAGRSFYPLYILRALELINEAYQTAIDNQYGIVFPVLRITSPDKKTNTENDNFQDLLECIRTGIKSREELYLSDRTLPEPEKKHRPCLGCGGLMWTDSGNRICEKCNRKRDLLGRIATPHTAHPPGKRILDKDFEDF